MKKTISTFGRNSRNIINNLNIHTLKWQFQRLEDEFGFEIFHDMEFRDNFFDFLAIFLEFFLDIHIS